MKVKVTILITEDDKEVEEAGLSDWNKYEKEAIAFLKGMLIEDSVPFTDIKVEKVEDESENNN